MTSTVASVVGDLFENLTLAAVEQDAVASHADIDDASILHDLLGHLTATIGAVALGFSCGTRFDLCSLVACTTFAATGFALYAP